MQATYKDRKNKKRDRFYLLFSVVLIVLFLKWGMPAIIDLITNQNVERISATDVLPPQSPILAAPPEATNSSTVELSGFTEAGASVSLMVNSAIMDQKTAGDDGTFGFLASLRAGENEVVIKATDAAQNESYSQPYKINFDITPINLQVESPKDGSEYFGKNNNTIDIVGSVEKDGVSVLVNNSFASVDRENKFTSRYQLNSGQNEIKIVALDKAGNQSELSIKVSYNP